jgi:hypothetical protein
LKGNTKKEKEKRKRKKEISKDKKEKRKNKRRLDKRHEQTEEYLYIGKRRERRFEIQKSDGWK